MFNVYKCLLRGLRDKCVVFSVYIVFKKIRGIFDFCYVRYFVYVRIFIKNLFFVEIVFR